MNWYPKHILGNIMIIYINPHLWSRLKVTLITFCDNDFPFVLLHVVDQGVPSNGDIVTEVAPVSGDLWVKVEISKNLFLQSYFFYHNNLVIICDFYLRMSIYEMQHNLSPLQWLEPAVITFVRAFRRAFPGYSSVELLLVNAHSGAMLSKKC